MEYDYAHTVAHPPPLSIKEIADIAVRFDYNPHVPLRRWLRTADTVLKEVCPPDATPPPTPHPDTTPPSPTQIPLPHPPPKHHSPITHPDTTPPSQPPVEKPLLPQKRPLPPGLCVRSPIYMPPGCWASTNMTITPYPLLSPPPPQDSGLLTAAQSNIYFSEGDEQQAYLLLLRWNELVLRFLPSHPEKVIPENLLNLTRAHLHAPDALRRLEYLKPRLEARYNAYRAEEDARRDEEDARHAAWQHHQQQQLQLQQQHQLQLQQLQQKQHQAPSSSSASLRLASAVPPSLSSRRHAAPGTLDLSMQRRMSASSINGPFSPPLMSSDSNKAAAASSLPRHSSKQDESLALEIARQEFEKRERIKREKRRLLALEAGRDIPLDSTGAEIRRIATPTTASFYPGPSHSSHTSHHHNNHHHHIAASPPPLPHLPQQLQPPPASYGRLRRESSAERLEYQFQDADDDHLIESVKALSLMEFQQQPPPSQPLARPPYQPVGTGAGGSYNPNYDPFSDYDFDGFLPGVPSKRDAAAAAAAALGRKEERSVGRWAGSYPTVPKRRHYSPPPPRPRPSPPVSEPAPPRPPKQEHHHHSRHHSHSHHARHYRADVDMPPARPPKVADNYTRSSSASSSSAPSTPVVEASGSGAGTAAAAARQFSTPATLENGTPLRTMFLPASLRRTFLSIARPNTVSNLETCGILCGTLIRNALFVSRLVIPEQEATSDTCATKDEEGLFEYCDREELMVLGWIHTHPTQTCFMSSVDLHTHASYQLMMPESIAIVCAPSKRPS